MSARMQVIAMMGKVVTPPTYATWDPSGKDSDFTLSSGNLVATLPSTFAGGVRSTIGKSSGKWYWEIVQTGPANRTVGIATAAYVLTDTLLDGAGAISVLQNGSKIVNGAVTGYASAYASGDTLGFYLDMDAGTLGMLINNVNQGICTTGLSGTYYAAASGSGSISSKVFTANFGATALTYSPPAGFNAGLYS